MHINIVLKRADQEVELVEQELDDQGLGTSFMNSPSGFWLPAAC